jgi:hypothetical protein
MSEAPASSAAPERCDRRQMRGLMDAHFSGSMRPGGELRLREHLPYCADCRTYYERHLLLERFDPQALGLEDRLARGLGLPSRRSPWAIWSIGLAMASATAVLALLVVHPQLRPLDRQFVARGPVSREEPAALQVYQIRKGAAPSLVGAAIAASDELAFAYRNPGHKKYLLVFGVDEQKRVYWFHPAWNDASLNPAAVPLSSAPGVHELPEAISHRFQGAALTIWGVFTDQPLTVREVEAAVLRHPAEATGLPLDGYQTVRRLRIGR